MTQNRMQLSSCLKTGADDIVREMIGFVAQRPMELMSITAVAQATANAPTFEPTPATATGTDWDTRAGTVALRIPKLRSGRFPPFLEPRRTAERLALSSRRPTFRASRHARSMIWVQAMGMSGISKSQVSRLCAEIDERCRPFLHWPIEGDWPLSVDRCPPTKVRGPAVSSRGAAIIAIGANTDGGARCWACRSGPRGRAVLDRLPAPGPRGCGVKLVISDAHEGLKAAVRKVISRDQCNALPVHFMRNVGVRAAGQRRMVSALIATIFAQETEAAAPSGGQWPISFIVPKKSPNSWMTPNEVTTDIGCRR